MGYLVHREKFYAWFLGIIKYGWLDKIAYLICCTIIGEPAVEGLNNGNFMLCHFSTKYRSLHEGWNTHFLPFYGTYMLLVTTSLSSLLVSFL